MGGKKRLTTEEFVEYAKKVHGDKYDYSKVKYGDTKTKVCIICPEHGEFWQTPNSHLSGCGCQKCGYEKLHSIKAVSKEEFLEKARKVHGDKYDYSKVNYVNGKTKVCIICPEHGEFWQTPNSHLSGCGCQKCANNDSSKRLAMSKEEFIERSTQKHNNRFDYDLTNYKNLSSEIIIIDKKTGKSYKQKCYSHIIGRTPFGSPWDTRKKITTEEFIERARKVHGDKYDYSKIQYKKSTQKIIVICPKHGEFEVTPPNFLKGRGCPKCGKEKRSLEQLSNTEEFIKKAKEIHGNKYDYSKVVYKNAKTNVIITCHEHGDFEQMPDKHLSGHGCLKCSLRETNPEKELIEFCNRNFTNVITKDRSIVRPKELDIFLPSERIAIEYNGLYWHSEICGKNSTYHLEKLNNCRKKSISLIQIFEDEYTNHRDLVYEKLKHIMGLDQNLPRIAGRKCNVKEIKASAAKAFLEQYHIQGYVGSKVYLGAFCKDKLIAVMTFKQTTKDSGKWELTRFASDYNYICQGVGGKLFKYFISNYNPQEIKSFADRRWTINEGDNIYTKLGFKFDSYTRPDYQYFKPKNNPQRFHKFNFRKQILHKKYGLPLTMTESEMVKSLGFEKIWDCGLIKYIWRRKNATNKENNTRSTSRDDQETVNINVVN